MWRRKGDEKMRFLSMIRVDENSGQVPSQQLMDDMDNFDALPNAEPEPVFAVDTNEGR